MRPNTALFFSTIAILGAGLLGGCTMPGGNMYSADKFTYVSDPYSPKTISLLDVRTRQVVWTTEIPVGQQLIVSFYEGSDPGANMPDVMKYGFAKAGSWSASLQSSIPVPGPESRRIDCTIRTAPEFPAGVVAPAPAPVPGPAQPTTATTKKVEGKKDMIDLPETEPVPANPDPKREVK